MQPKITQMQLAYREWCTLHQDGQALLDKLKRRTELFDELCIFYFGTDGQSTWQMFYERIENGEPVDLTTDGEYSIMGQDTLWEMACDERAFYEQLLAVVQQRLAKLEPAK